MSDRRCFKCQGLAQIVVDYRNRKAVTLVEWEAVKEEETEVEPVEELEEDKEES